jgi:uroporphyrinogen III methyltransferase/synthase
MGIKNLESITEKVIKHGRDPQTPVAVVRWASTSEQRTVVGNLENIAEIVRKNNIKPPSLVIIGEVVNLRDTINWYEKRPLFSKRLVVTRTRDQASELVNMLENYGAECIIGFYLPALTLLIIFLNVCLSWAGMFGISRVPRLQQ